MSKTLGGAWEGVDLYDPKFRDPRFKIGDAVLCFHYSLGEQNGTIVEFGKLGSLKVKLSEAYGPDLTILVMPSWIEHAKPVTEEDSE